MTTEDNKQEYPAVFQIEYPEHPSRLLALLGALFFVKLILVIPHIIIVSLLQVVAGIVVYIGYWVVLITGRYSRDLFNFGVGVQRWDIRVQAWMNGWTDSYPPFNLN